MKKILFAFAIVGMFGFAACDQKKDEAKPADKPADQMKPTDKPADQAAKPADQAAKPATPAAAPAAIGVAECDEYVTKYSKCIDSKMPEAGREQSRASVKTMVEAWTKAASTPEGKAALPKGCKDALDAAKQATASMGCEW